MHASKSLPACTKTKVNLLVNRAIIAVLSMEELIATAFQRGHRAGMEIDGGSNVNKMHIEGVIIKAGPATFTLDAPEADFEHHSIAVARGWEYFLTKDYPRYKFFYHVSDDAGQCARARRILALRHPHMLLMRCWAHQINFMVKDLLGISDFKEVCKQAINSAKVIKASSASAPPPATYRCRPNLWQATAEEHYDSRGNALELNPRLFCHLASHSSCLSTICNRAQKQQRWVSYRMRSLA